MKRVDLDDEEWFKALLYGAPGSKKTRTAASAALDPRTSPCLQLDIGGNPVSIRDYVQRPDIIRIDKIADLNPIYDYLRKGQPETHLAHTQFGLRTDYRCVIVDGCTDLQRISFGQVTGNQALGPGDIPSKYERQHFGSVLAQMTTFARLFYGLPMHVIITALEREEDDGGLPSYRPLLLGQSAGEVAGYAFVVARMVGKGRLESKVARELGEALKDPRASVALFSPEGRYYAKDQTGKLPTRMVDPTVTQMLDKIYGPYVRPQLETKAG